MFCVEGPGFLWFTHALGMRALGDLEATPSTADFSGIAPVVDTGYYLCETQMLCSYVRNSAGSYQCDGPG